MFTPAGGYADTVINNTLVIKAERKTVQIEHLPEVFFPRSGLYSLRSKSSHLCQTVSRPPKVTNHILIRFLVDVHRVFIDDKSPYVLGCGQAFSRYGIATEEGAIVVVRPDLCKFSFISLDIAVLIIRRCGSDSSSFGS